MIFVDMRLQNWQNFMIMTTLEICWTVVMAY